MEDIREPLGVVAGGHDVTVSIMKVSGIRQSQNKTAVPRRGIQWPLGRPDIALLTEQLANLSHLVDMPSIPHMFSIAYYVDSMFCRVILLSYQFSRNAILLLCPWM